MSGFRGFCSVIQESCHALHYSVLRKEKQYRLRMLLRSIRLPGDSFFWVGPAPHLANYISPADRIPLRDKPTVSPTVVHVGLLELYSLAANLLLMASGSFGLNISRGNSATQPLLMNNLRLVIRSNVINPKSRYLQCLISPVGDQISNIQLTQIYNRLEMTCE